MSETIYVPMVLNKGQTSMVPKELFEKNLFYTHMYRLSQIKVIARLAKGLTKDKSLEIWPDILPEDGKYEFNIGVELPFYLPTRENNNDYEYILNGKELIISLKMLKCYISEDKELNNNLNYYLLHQSFLSHLKKEKEQYSLTPIPIKTFISRRISIETTNAEQTIQENFINWKTNFTDDISTLLKYIRSTDSSFGYLMHEMSFSSFPIIWLAIKGKNKSECHHFAWNINLTTLIPTSDINVELDKKIENLISQNEIPIYCYALSLSRTYYYYNSYDLAVVQICIACESILWQEYEKYLKHIGVSQKKIDDNQRNITFSQLLNIHLFSMRDITKLLDYEEIINSINWARDQRNHIVHGSLKERIPGDNVEKAIKNTEKLIDFLLSKKK